MAKPTLQRIIDFQHLLQAFNEVDRVVHRKHHGTYRQENDTEHSYNLAMTAWFLAPHFPDLDSNLLLRYALIHDIVEIHAGDTYIYGSDAELSSKHAREQAAAKQLQHDWPDFPEAHELIADYENRSTPEARFVYALDKIMPILQIYVNGGYSWHKEGVTIAMLVKAKKDKVALSPEIAPYFNAVVRLLENSPELISPA